MTAFLKRHHAAAAVSLVLLFMLLLGSSVYFTRELVEARRSELTAREIQLGALKRRLAQPPAPRPSQARDVEPLFGDGFALAANELQNRIVGLIENAGGTLVSVGVDPPVTADDDSGRRVVVQAVAELGNDALQEMLYRLEANAPFVFVDSLAVTRITPRGGSDVQDAARSPQLSVDLRAAGYFRRGAP
jgi:general secretion pathway protein M